MASIHTSFRRVDLPWQGKDPFKTKQKTPKFLEDYIRDNWPIRLSSRVEIFKYLVQAFDNLENEGLESKSSYHIGTCIKMVQSNEMSYSSVSIGYPIYMYFIGSIIRNRNKTFSNFDEIINVLLKKFLQIFRKFFVENPEKAAETIVDLASTMRESDMKTLSEICLSILKRATTALQLYKKDYFLLIVSSHIILSGMYGSDTQSIADDILTFAESVVNWNEPQIEGLISTLKFQSKLEKCAFPPRYLYSILRTSIPTFKLDDLRMIVEKLPVPLIGDWQSSFLSSFLIPLRDDFALHVKQENELSIIANERWTGIITEVHHLLAAAQTFISNNNCTESLSGSSPVWLKLIPQAIQFEHLQPSHVKEMTFLFDDTVFVKQCKAEIYDMFLRIIQKNYALIEPHSFIALIELLETHQKMDIKVFENYLQSFDDKYPLNDYGAVILKLKERDEERAVNSAKSLFEGARVTLSVEDNVLPVMYTYLLSFDLDELLDIPQAEEMVLKFLNVLIKNVTLPILTEHLKHMMIKPTFLKENRFQNLVCEHILKHLSSNGKWINEVIEKACDQLVEAETKFIETSPGFRFVSGILNKICFSIEKSNNLDEWREIIKHAQIPLLIRAIKPIIEHCSNNSEDSDVRGCIKFFKRVQETFKILEGDINAKKVSLYFVKLLSFQEKQEKIKEMCEILGNPNNIIESLSNVISEYGQIIIKLHQLLIVRYKHKTDHEYYLMNTLANVLKPYELLLPLEIHNNLGDLYDVKGARENVQAKDIIPLPVTADENRTILLQFFLVYKQLESFLGPLKTDVSYLICFDILKSKFIKMLMAEKYFQIKATDRSATILHEAIQYCIEKVKCAIADGSISLNEMNLDLTGSENEIRSLGNFVRREFKITGVLYGWRGFAALNSMSHFQNLVPHFAQMFTQFELRNCLSSQTFELLTNYCEQLKNPASVLLSKAVEMQNTFQIFFPSSIEKCEELILLFEEIKLADLYVNFCKRKGFGGENGKRLFNMRYNFILQEMHDLSEQHAVDALWMAYNGTILFFIDENADFKDFAKNIRSLGNIKNAIAQLKALQHQSLQFIEECFSRDERESKESVSKKLSEIFEQYQMHYYLRDIVEMDVVRPIEGNDVAWDSKDILEFSSKLELLKMDIEDNNDEFYQKIKEFEDVNRISNEACDLLRKLKQIGHFKYQKFDKSVYKFPFNSSHGIPIETMKANLDSWKAETVEKRLKHPVLSLFSNFKILSLYDLMVDRNIQRLAHDLIGSMIFVVDGIDLEKAKAINNILNTLNFDHYLSEDHFESVGLFLTDFRHKFESQIPSITTPPATPTETNFRLYMIENPMPFDIYASTMMLLDYKPLPFQVLHCSSLTTIEIIVLFFSQMKQNHNYSYVIVGVNKLPNTLQEVIINECLGLQDIERSINGNHFDISFVENGPSLLRTMPWCHQEHTTPTSKKCEKTFISCNLVYGLAGNGKTHYIQNQMKMANKKIITISINEDFQYMLSEFISRMSILSIGTPDILVYVNVTLPYTKDYCLNATEIEFIEETCTLVNWFFFSLLILGYIEDPNSCVSFSLNQVNTMEVFVEVPVIDSAGDDKMQLTIFNDYFPIFKFVGKECLVSSTEDSFRCINDNEKLVCQYLKAKKDNKLDKLFARGWFNWFWPDKGISFKDYENLSDRDCSDLIQENMSPNIKERRIYQKLFVSYLACRCQFLEESVFLRFYKGNTDEVETRTIWNYFKSASSSWQRDEYCDQTKLRSLLLKLMKEEVREICIPMKGALAGFCPPHLQLIYVHKDKNFTFLHNGVVQLSKEEEKIINTFKFDLPTRDTLRDSKELEKYLYSALQITEGDKSILKEIGYVITLDYLQKMLSVHERLKCGMPVIISGETGVGKTFLFETLSKLYSESHIQDFRLWKKEFAKAHLKNSQTVDDIHILSANDIKLANQQMCLNEVKLKIEFYLPFLEESLLFCPEEFSHDSETTKYFLTQFLFGDVKQLFYVLKVHPGLKPSDIRNFLKPIISKETDRQQAQDCKVMVFFDEINTSSCLGFLKEIVIDHSMDGITLPSSLFIVAACNPMRGNAVAINDAVITDADSEQWFKGNYVVHPMMPSFSLLMWDFGSLNESQEEDYILAKLSMMDSRLNSIDIENLKNKIAVSQKLIRLFTEDYMVEMSRNKSIKHNFRSEVKIASSSAVSQRDIQRVLKLYVWFKKSHKTLCGDTKRWGESEKDISMRSLYLSLALVYYFRLNKVYREKYAEELSNGRYNFLDILYSELKWFMENLSIPPGIANTQALRENVYAMIICIMNCIPLIITGPPGTSKTLSFKIVQANMQGDVSPMPLFRTEIFNRITPHMYQCSKHSTPTDIDEVFEKANKMRTQISESGQDGTSVVFLDEAGLPDDNLQVLKVLHYHLENPEVSFIALTNRVLDAAKSNRAICLFQVNTSEKDIYCLARANVSLYHDTIDENSSVLMQLSKISSIFHKEMLRTEFNSMFGLRDIMHLFSFIRRNLDGDCIEPETLVKAIQRNFSGTENFDAIAKKFLSELGYQDTLLEKKYASSVATLRESLMDRPEDLSFENEVRHKLLIDHSEDGSLILNLFKSGLLDRAETKVFSSSHLRKDIVRKTIYLTKVRNSVTRGHMIVLDQFNDIYESLYDLFNQRFTCIEDSDKNKKYYTRIAIGSRFSNCFVNPSFQCVVILKKSALPDTPAPFLNRFEKFDFSHQSFLDELLTYKSPLVKLLLKAMDKVNEFVKDIPSPGIFGQEKHTLLSLVLTHISPPNEKSSLSLLATPCGEPIFDVFMKYIDYKEGVYDGKMLFIFEDINHAIETVISDDETFSITRPIIEETFHTMENMEGNMEDDDSVIIVSEDVNKMLLILLQYLVVRLTKEIVQLIPPEVFVAIKEKIPSYYTHVYLNQQAHYSLQDLLLSHLPSDFTESKVNKAFCYCRYSSLVIPRTYFPLDKEDGFKTSDWMKLKAILPTTCTDNHNEVCSLEIHPELHGDYIYRKIKHFLEVDSYTLLLLYANPKLIPKETINYTKLVIEELEFEKQTYKRICFLLIFPSELFFDHFYPSYYLDGWSHYYLDSLAPSTNIGSLNLKSCFQFSLADIDIDSASLFEDLYTAEIPIICTSFISAPFYDRKYGDLKALSSLISFEGDLSIGKNLFKKFCSQWTPKKMEHILLQATSSSLTHSCKISMTDAVEMLVKFSFRDFMSYMLTFLTRHDALAALLDDERCAVFLDFIRYRIKVHKLPDTSAQMQLEIASLHSSSTESRTFPFFQQIHDMIELDLESVKSKPHISNVTEHTVQKLVDELKGHKDFISDALNDSPAQLWEYYLLNFLSYYNRVTVNSELFRYFEDQAAAHCPTDTFGNKLVWLHFSFANTPRNVLSVLSLASDLNADKIGSKVFSGREVVELLKDQKTTAEKIVEMFFDVLTNYSQQFNSSEMEKQKELLDKYHEIFFENQMTALLDIKLMPLFAAKKNAIITYFEISVIDIQCANNFMAIVTEQLGNVNEQENKKYPPSYFVDKTVSVMTQCSDLDEFLNHGKKIACNPSKNAVRIALQTIIPRLMSNDDDDDLNYAHDVWLYDLLKHGDAQNLLSTHCHTNDKLFTPCFLYQLFSVAAKREQKFESSTEAIPIPYLPFYYKHLRYNVTEVKRKNAMYLSLCFLKRLHALNNSGVKQYGELILDYHKLTERASHSDQVELQALLLELIKSVAVNIAIGRPVIMNELNKVLNSTSFQGHNSIMIVYQIWKQCRSFTNLRKLVASQYSFAKEITSLEEIHDLYGKEEKHFEREILIDLETIFSHHDDVMQFQHNQKLIAELSQIFDNRTEGAQVNEMMLNKLRQTLQRRCGRDIDWDKHFFLLCFLFVVYETFYFKKEQLTELVSGIQLKLNYILPEQSVSVCCLFVDGGKRGLETFDDDLQNSFANLIPSDDEKEMWLGVTMIVGAVLTMAKKSCHLWDHLFNPDCIKWIPGATIPGTLDIEKNVYEDLTKLKRDGFFISQQRYDYVTRGTMSLPCLYFIQFANFACLCIHYLLYSHHSVKAQQKNFYGNINHAREECWQGLRRSWRLLGTRLDVTTEERLSLIEYCINRIIKVKQYPAVVDQASLDIYEHFIDKEIFRPAWKSVISKRESIRDRILRLHPESIQSQIIMLDRNYPVFATKHSFLTFVFCSTVFNESESPHFKLNRFLLMRPLLNAIALNLPTFVDFYQWLHCGLAKRYTRAEVHNLSLSKLLSNLRESGEYHNIQKRLDQEKKIYAFTKEYKDALFSDKGMATITQDTKICDIISKSGSFGTLYHYIERMIRVHNGFLSDVKWKLGEIDSKDILPFTSKPIHSVEDIDDLMPLIEQHCCVLPSCTNTSAIDDSTLIESVTSQVYDLKSIQKAIHVKYIAKMKQVQQPNYEVSWVYKDEEESVTNLFIKNSVSLEGIIENDGIPAADREYPDQAFITKMEFRCHSLSYFSLLHIAMGLRIAASYLAKALNDGKTDFQTKNQIGEWTLPKFLNHHTGKKMDNLAIIKDVLYIDVQKLDLSHTTALQEVIMRDVVKALHVFVLWLENGMYEYNYFPITVKEDMKESSAWDNYVNEARIKGKTRITYDKIKNFRLQLSKCDSIIRKRATENNVLTLPLGVCLPKSLLENEIFACFPGITVSNYVKFSVLLRQTENNFLKTLLVDADQITDDKITQWNDRIPENSINMILNVCINQSMPIVKKKDLSDLTTEDVTNFIKSINMEEEYIEEANDSDVNGKKIIELNDRQLMKLLGMRGDPLAYHQFKVFIMREYGNRSSLEIALVYPPKRIVDMFAENELQDAVKNIKKYQIDGEMLLEICENDAMLKDLTSDPVRAKEIIQNNLLSS